MEINKFI